MSNSSSIVTGLIIVDHGSRRQASNDSLLELVAAYRGQATTPIVEAAHMELAEPSIANAFAACVEQGANRVVCFPYFLSPGRHWYQDVPDLVAAAAAKHPGTEWLVTAPIGLHPALFAIIDDRISHCTAHAEGDAADCPQCAGSDRCQFRKVC